MATLEQIEDNARAALVTAGYTAAASWALPRWPLVSGGNARVRIAKSELLDAGSNVSIRTVDLIVEIAELATDTTSATYAAAELLVNTRLSELTAAAFWAAVSGVRGSPLPEVEVEDEPERIGRAISFSIRVKMALEG